MQQLTDEHVNAIANRARVLSEPTRVRILYVLARGEQAVGSIASAIAAQQSTVSKHLQVLFHAGLVDHAASRAVIHSIASEDLSEWCDDLGQRQLSESVPSRSRMKYPHSPGAFFPGSRVRE